MSEEYKFYAGRPERRDFRQGFYGKLPHIPEGVRYYWYSGALGGAHEYGDLRIVDSRSMDGDEELFACDDEYAAEWLCELLNDQHADRDWEEPYREPC